MKQLHPLINHCSLHYQSEARIAILEMEKIFTVEAMFNFCSINVYKYEFRKDLKGQLEADIEKIKTYKNYLEVLIKLKRDGMSGFLVCDALKQARYEFVYRVSDLVEDGSLFK